MDPNDNAKKTPLFDRELLIKDLVVMRAERHLDKVFVTEPENNRILTYRELGALVDRFAGIMCGLGIRNGDVVAMSCRNGIDFVTVYLAVMSVGGIVNPINTSLKTEEVRLIMENCEPKLLIVEPPFVDTFMPVLDGIPSLSTVLLINNLELQQYNERQALIQIEKAMSPATHQEEPALILYTSGTTGKPKGVLLSQRNLLSDVHHVVNWHGLSEDDRCLCILPLFHINGQVISLLSSLYSGGSLVIPSRFSARSFWSTVATLRVTWFSCVPTILSILLNQPREQLSGMDLTSLKFCLCGSAPLPVELLKEFEHTFNVPIIEGYGLTETACRVTFNPHFPRGVIRWGEDDGFRKIGSVGVPLPCNEVSIVDDHDTEQQAGILGEIVVRGENVTQGYFKNIEANEEAFKSGWFHTGDIGFYDDDGYFYVKDRKKDLIIRGGQNIYPREVDEVLYQHPKIKDAATIGVPDKIYGEDVESFVVLREGEECTVDDLIAFCRKRLADYKCPKKIRLVESIPKGPSGKLLRRELAILAAN